MALLFDEQSGLAGCRVTVHETCEKDHGRLETRRVVATEQIDWLHDSHGLRSIAKVESRRELLAEGKVEEDYAWRRKADRRGSLYALGCPPVLDSRVVMGQGFSCSAQDVYLEATHNISICFRLSTRS